GGEKIAAKYQIPFLGAIPLDMQIREGSDKGEPPVSLGSAEQKKYYQDIVENILTHSDFNI
ncbi:MAG: P-loop NTPase, partial [Sulfurimonas sp.]